MAETIYGALVNLFAGWTPFYLLLGVLVGLVVGILPALGTTAGMALLVPFVFGMDKTAALAMMTGLLAVVATGDTVTSIMLGIPGASDRKSTRLNSTHANISYAVFRLKTKVTHVYPMH